MGFKLSKYLVVGGVSAALLSVIVGSDARVSTYAHPGESDVDLPMIAVDTPEVPEETTPVILPYPFSDQSTGDPLNYPNSGGLMLNNPSNVNTNVEYDPATGNYNISQKLGGMDYRPPTYMDNEEFQEYQFKKQTKSYWNQRSHAESQNAQTSTTIPKLHVGGEIFDRIFGGNTVDIRPNGSAELIFAYQGTKTENPALPEKQRKISTFDFDEKIQLNVVGKIGDKLKLTTSYNTEATFDYENQMKLEYTGYEDEIIKKIEAGNVSMPLNGSLITGSQTLFGVKTQLQFGRLTVTSILSQQKGKKSEVEVTGGAQVSKYEVAGDAYEYNRHFFLGQYFRDQFNSALAGLPFISSSVNINRVEVWVTNSNGATNDVREAISFADLAEDPGTPNHITPTATGYILDNAAGALPFNDQNTLYQNMVALTGTRATSTAVPAITSGTPLQQSIGFMKQNMRKLQPSEYTLNARLGFISLNQQLNPEQVLAVAYQYTAQGQTYNVGEFSDGGISAPSILFLKMLKADAPNTRYPIWNLMMKNVYSIGAYQVNSKDFKLDVFYTNSATGTDINYLPVSECQTQIKGKPLIQVLNLDRLNAQSDQVPDGVFDYVDGVTINSNNGRVIFPVVEPFGDFLRSKFDGGCDATEANRYVFDPLYDSTKTSAQQFPNLNRFKIKGQYQSASGSEISLGAPNVPQGSVTVTAGGVQLTENVDYTVDYTLGRLKIVNEGILNSGTPIKISLESNALFAIQSKTLFGTHLDYRINKDFNIGATVMNLTERPLTKKVNQGDEPIRNTIWGFDGNYRTDAPFLTRLIDKLPFLETKEMSTITAAGEFAYLIPGHSKAIGKDGNSYVDDFEGSQSTIDLRQQGTWSLASTPQGQPSLFPEADSVNSLAFGYNRAKLAWYAIDPILQRSETNTPTVTQTPTEMSNNFAREIPETEVFPNKQSPTGQVSNITTFDLAYYPSERGPYNYNTDSTATAAGLNTDGTLKDPASRWGGIMRSISTNDFEATNIEYIQFWVMDPFNSDNPLVNWNTTGELYFNIGNVSEDVLHDGYKSAENVLPAPSTADQNAGQNLPTDTTIWGRVPLVQPLVNAFNTDEGDRAAQDVGLDGWDNAQEQSFFQNYLTRVAANVSSSVYGSFSDDPSGDDFHYFRGSDYDANGVKTLGRYKRWNGLEQNSRTNAQYQQVATYPTPGPTSGTPNSEDINRDNNLSTTESYFQYHISLKPSDFCNTCVGTNYITDVYETNGQNIKDGSSKPIRWFQFKIPIKVPESRVGTIENFQSIRFMRMFMTGVDKPIVLRFARLELVRGEWRKYGFDLLSPGLYVANDDPNTQFDIGAVNIEENGNRTPVNYVLPPGIEREESAASATLVQQNEQSLALTVCNLQDGKARAAYKNTNLDVRSYKKLKMYVHAEGSTNASDPLHDKDLHLFVRLGTDFTDNYYEYDIPLVVTAPGNYNGTNEDDQYRVWPSDNEMILEFEKLQSAKQKRNIAMFGSTTLTLASEYTVPDGTRTITIKGNPNLSAIKTIMIGVRNPKHGGPGDNDDGQPKCAQIWVNELRLSDFDQKGGWAANARVTAKLADFGTVSVSGSMYTPGFGSIENKVSERKRETLKQYDVSSSLELGKFIPEDYNVHIPMYVGYSETFITPQYNPLDPDILLAPTLKDPTIPQDQRDSIRRVTQDYTKRKGINFTNVKKDKGKNSKKSHIYDVENWAASYSYNEIYRRNVNIEYNTQKTYRGGLNYNYAPQPKNIKPFAKTKIFQSKYLLIIKDINFYPYPNKIGFSTDVNRDYSTSKGRNTTTDDIIILPTFNKTFNMNRNYDLKYDITKNLKLDFTASNQERILEPDGAITDETRDTLRKEFFQRLTKTQYNHQTSLNYNIPINKLPLLDFTTASVRYAGTYSWQHSPLYDTHRDAEGNTIGNDSLGNTIQNSRNISWNGQLNMVTLYNKIPYFKKINQKNTKNKNPKAPAIKPGAKTTADSTKKKDNFEVLEYVARLVMTLKTVNVTYADNAGTLLPGYRQNTQMMGMDEHFQGPTTGFIFGSQEDIRDKAIQNNWLVKTSSLNTPYTTTSSQNLNIRANAEPFPDLKVELTATRTQSKSKNEFFRWSETRDMYVHDAPTETGNFSISYLTYRTSFRKNGDETFQAFLDARPNISARLGGENPNSTASVNGYAEGYNETSQDVLIPSFLAAYSGKNPNSVGLNPMPKVPKPNWRVTYDGLSKLEKIKKYFKSFTLSHAYRSSYSVGGYTSNLLFDDPDGDGYTAIRENVSSISNNPNFLTKNQINTVTISEQWSPFIKLEMTMNNSILVNFEYKKDRNLSLGLTSKTITELTGREIIGGLGYRIRELPLGNAKIKGKQVKSDLNLKADISFRRNETVMRRIVEEVSQSTGGTNIISLKVSADYVISEKINIRLFYDRIINKPVISTSFPTTNTNAGVSLRLTLSN
ncbi:MAG: cell surface protein SprA [Bacteroidetes bacterium]|nr:cell surface protein SprA [Bacteroidota bacterium]